MTNTQVQQRTAIGRFMAESPVTVYQGGTLAQQVLSSAPEGMLIAPVWRRIAAFAIDVIAMSLFLHVLSRFTFLEILISWNYLTEDARYAASFLMTWALFFGSLWLYWKYTGRAYGRSLGQRAFRIAIVHDNGTLLELHHFGHVPSTNCVTSFLSSDGCLGSGMYCVHDQKRLNTERPSMSAITRLLP